MGGPEIRAEEYVEESLCETSSDGQSNGEGEAIASPSFRLRSYLRNLLAAEMSTMIAAIGITTFTRMKFFPERATISTEIGEGF